VEAKLIFAFISLITLQLQAANIGNISELKGEALVNRSGEALTAKLELGVESYDDVRTANSRVGLTFIDDSVVRLTEHSKLILDEVIFDPDPSKSKIGLTFASGTARFITGKIGGINKENIKINTPTSQIGIRGTDFTVTVDELGRSLVILLPDINGISSGEITVETAAGLVVLNTPYESTTTSVWENSPTEPVTLDITLDLIDNMLLVSPPKEEEIIDEESNNVRTGDFLDFNDLDIDLLNEDVLAEEDLEFTELDINYLDVNFFEDLLEVLEEIDGLKEGNEKESSKQTFAKATIEGTTIGQDPNTQIITIVDSQNINISRQVNDFAKVQLESQAGVNLIISQDGKEYIITINKGGTSNIIIRQSS
jgi:hypothetical protein